MLDTTRQTPARRPFRTTFTPKMADVRLRELRPRFQAKAEETCIVMIPRMSSLQLHHMQVVGHTLFIVTSVMTKELVVVAVH